MLRVVHSGTARSDVKFKIHSSSLANCEDCAPRTCSDSFLKFLLTIAANKGRGPRYGVIGRDKLDLWRNSLRREHLLSSIIGTKVRGKRKRERAKRASLSNSARSFGRRRRRSEIAICFRIVNGRACPFKRKRGARPLCAIIPSRSKGASR